MSIEKLAPVARFDQASYSSSANRADHLHQTGIENWRTAKESNPHPWITRMAQFSRLIDHHWSLPPTKKYISLTSFSTPLRLIIIFIAFNANAYSISYSFWRKLWHELSPTYLVVRFPNEKIGRP